jgi:hypothetical protein
MNVHEYEFGSVVIREENVYIYTHISLQVLPVFGEVCETVRQQKDSLLGEKTGLPNAALLERLTPPTLSMTW